mgnify:CR=1 FL=1
MAIVAISELVPSKNEIFEMLRSIFGESIRAYDVPANTDSITSAGMLQPLFIGGASAADNKDRPLIEATSVLQTVPALSLIHI